MTRLFLRSLGLHLNCLVDSFRPGRHAGAPLGWRRLAILLLGFPLFLLLQLVHAACLALDELLFPGYRRVPVKEPLFITGLPRSGTTFVHRTLAEDRAQFTTFLTWEAVLAPSILQRKLLHALAAADRGVGRPAGRILEAFLRRAGGDNAIHEVDLAEPEEDYLALLPVGACFILVLCFPFHPDFWALGRLDRRIDPSLRADLLAFYRSILQRHLFCEGRGRRLLSKNAAFASWTGPLRETFPDARFLLCLREPVSALSSQLSSIDAGCRFFGVDPVQAGLPAAFRALVGESLETIRGSVQNGAEERTAVVDLKDLERDPAGVLSAALRRVGTEPEGALEAALARAGEVARTRRSGHRHSLAPYGLKDDEIESCLSPVYEAILRDRKAGSPAGRD